MKTKLLIFISVWLFSAIHSFAVPVIGTVTSNNLNIGSVDGYIIVNGISGSGAITISASSSNNSILSVTGVKYTSPQKVAIINVKEFGNSGSVNLTVTANDGSPTNKVFSINVGDFYKKGCMLSIYDIVFWTNNLPSLTIESVLDTIVPTSANNMQDDENGIYKGLPLTQGGPNGSKYGIAITTRLKGYYTPPSTGYYLFVGNAPQGVQMNLYKNNEILPVNVYGRFQKEIEVLSLTNKISFVTTLSGGNTYGFLASGSAYDNNIWDISVAYLGTNPPNIVTVSGNGVYNTPSVAGVNPVVMSGNQITPYSDFKKPILTETLNFLRKSNNKIYITWKKAIDPDEESNSGIFGYKIYVDGKLNKILKGENNTSYVLSGLDEATNYSIFYTCFDKNGNESFPSNVINETTYTAETNKPTPPNSFTVLGLGDMSINVAWSGATDVESAIFGYNLFVDGIKYNTSALGILSKTNQILKTYQPNTVHEYYVTALDGSLNESLPSLTQVFTTLGFDHLLNSPGVKKVAMDITTDYVGKSEGIGLNGAAFNRNDYLGSTLDIHTDLAPSMVRWGSLDANPVSFSSRSGLVAKNRPNSATFSEFIKFATFLKAHAEIAIGTDDNPEIDWRANPTNTMQRFIGYIQGTKTIAGFPQYNLGYARRLEEGFVNPPLYDNSTTNVYIEFGCEPWGGTSNGVGVDHNAGGFNDYKVYALWARELANAAKAIPGFDSTRIKLYYSGREPHPTEFGSKELHEDMFFSPGPDRLDGYTLGGYVGGNIGLVKEIEVGKSELDYFKNAREEIFKKLAGLKLTMNIDLTATVNGNPRQPKLRPSIFYETDMSSETINKKFGQAILMADFHMQSLKLGQISPLNFALGDSQWGLFQSGTIKMPRYYVMKLLNRFVKSNILGVSGRTKEVLLKSDGNVSQDPDPVSMNAYHKDGKYVVLLVSKDFEHDFEVQLNLPAGITPVASSGKKYILRPETNFDSKGTILDSENVVVNNKLIVTVPKYTLVLLTFSGNTLTNRELTVGYTNYRKPTSVSLSVEEAPSLSPNIETPLGTMEFKTSFVPSNVYEESKRLQWKIFKSSPTMEIDIQEKNNGSQLNIQAQNCSSIGTVTVVGELMDNPNLFSFTRTFTITNQVVDLDNLLPCPTSKINETNIQNLVNFNVSPNPSEGTVTLTANLSGSVVITNIQGSVIYQTEFNQNSKKSILNLEPGIYIAKFTSKLGTSSKKIVITN